MMHQTSKSSAGMAAVELAMVMGVLVLTLMGTVDFSRVMYAAVTVADAARAGVQYGMQSNAHSGNMEGMKQAARDNAQDLEEFSASAERFCGCRNGATVNCVTGSCAEGPPRIYVRVRGQHTFSALTGIPGVPKQVRLNNSAVIRLQ